MPVITRFDSHRSHSCVLKFSNCGAHFAYLKFIFQLIHVAKFTDHDQRDRKAFNSHILFFHLAIYLRN